MSRSVRVAELQPFRSRVGIDMVLGLAFRYDPDLVEELKEAIRALKQVLGYPKTVNGGYRQAPGGWLPDQKVWFIEQETWPLVFALLRRLGYEVICEPPVTEPTDLDWPHRGGARRGPTEGGGRSSSIGRLALTRAVCLPSGLYLNLERPPEPGTPSRG